MHYHHINTNPQVQAIVDHHHADVKTASKVRFAEPGAEPLPDDAPSPPLAELDEKDKDDKVNIKSTPIMLCSAKKHSYSQKKTDIILDLNFN